MQIEKLKRNTKHFSIGKTVNGKNIWCFVLGDNPNKKIIIQGSVHAREYLTALMMIRQIEYLKNFYIDGTIYFVPLVNVDAVQLVTDGIDKFSKKTQNKIKSFCDIDKVKLFKANINGVDLNTNFDANFGGGKCNIIIPSYQNFIGKFAHDQPETQALVKLTNIINPHLTISYHLKGEVIYYGFDGQSSIERFRDNKIVDVLSRYTSYKKVLTKASAGGYKDYCIVHYGVPSFTIEIGKDKFSHPFPDDQLDYVFNQNKHLPLLCLKVLE